MFIVGTLYHYISSLNTAVCTWESCIFRYICYVIFALGQNDRNFDTGGNQYSKGRAIAQVVSRWLPTTAARVRARVWSSGICGGQSGARAGFLRVLRFPLPIHSTKFSILTITRGRYNRPRINGRRAEWTQFGLYPPLCKLKKNQYSTQQGINFPCVIFYRI
jgi:hypothetical protein